MRAKNLHNIIATNTSIISIGIVILVLITVGFSGCRLLMAIEKIAAGTRKLPRFNTTAVLFFQCDSDKQG